MFNRIINFVTSHPKRVIALWAVVAIGLATVSAAFGYKVTTDDTAQFLPKGSESAQATRYAQTAFGQVEGTQTVTVLVKRADGRALTSADRAEIRSLTVAMPRLAHDARERAGRIVTAQAGPLASDGRFQLVGLQWKANTTDPIAQDHFRAFRDAAAAEGRSHGLKVGLTGGVASSADYTKATEGTRSLSQALLFGAIVVLSLLFFRGPLAALVPLLTIYFVAAAASGLVVAAALAFGLDLDVGTPQLITVVLVGIGVDYFLFLLFRLRERLRAGDDRRTAASHAAASIGPVIASAALAVVAAFATMGLAEFGQFRVLGPSIAISVLVMLLAGVTLMPAIAAVTGRALFWPSRSWARERTDGPAARLGHRIARTPGRAALAVVAVLVVLSTFALGTRMSYDLSAGPSTAATQTADEISAALSKGASDPQTVYVKASDGTLTAARLQPLRERVAGVDGVSAVAQPVLTADRSGARIDVALEDAAYTEAAMNVVRGPVREAAHAAAPARTTVMVGGTAAVFADVSDSVDHDMRLILPVAAALILLILVATLRSAIAPIYLLGAVVLEFAATLGAAVLVFQHIGGEAGVAFILPLTLFLFVVALGTDYNILMTARLREEMLAGKPVREAVADAVRHVAPAVGAAGLVLASSFGTLMLESGQASREQGFAMAFGILLASLVVSSILVPALTAVIGRWAWKAPPRIEDTAPQPAG
ncbi:MAG TPA: MMPL family transporter [Solirubrobacteraceae bacterium]|nr:MMPL family transporter [Solirubrobacteraceae bacterium]